MGPILPAAALLLVGLGLGARGKDLLRATLPRVGRASRPLVIATIRGGYVLTREMRQMAESVREDLEDITAEAVLEAETTEEKPPVQGNSAKTQSE
jgi:hypothetical protein